jgi:Kef-type K+ transport system membrane component KefB
VGITARVLKDLDAMAQPETRVILGAAVIDDVLGLIVLAVVASIAEFGSMPGALGLTKIIGLAAGFLVGALVLGAYVMPGVFRAASKLRTQDVLGAVAIGLCLLLAGVSGEAGLAPIVGAFAAGLILDEVHVRPFGKTSARDLTEIIGPIVAVVAPIFFVRTGMMVQLSGIGTEPLLLALALTAVAIIGKLVAGLGVRGKTVDRLAVGIGMVPRGEVGLIFANVGAGITYGGKPLIAAGVYAAIVLMVMATTVVTPPWLAQRLRKVMRKQPDDA